MMWFGKATAIVAPAMNMYTRAQPHATPGSPHRLQGTM